MRRLATLQLAGPVALCIAVGAADSAAWALSQSPSSALLWYLNLEVFSLFRRSRLLLSDVGGLPFAQMLLIAGLLGLIALIGMILRQNLLVALSSNLSLLYAGFLICSWYAWISPGSITSASLTVVHVPADSNFYLLLVLLIACAVSFSASHLLYIRNLRKRA